MTLYLVIGVALLIALIAVAITVIGQTRKLAVRDQISEDKLAEFKSMREEGTISEEEYRRLKKIVADQTVQKAKGEQSG